MLSPTSQRRSERMRSGAKVRPSFPQRCRELERDPPVERDRAEQQRACDRLVPERRDAEDVGRREDRVQEERAEGRADSASAPAEDGDAADDDGGDHLELVPAPGRRVDRSVARRIEDTGDAGDAAADREGSEDTSPARNPGEPRGVGIRADRVELTARPERAQVVRAGTDDRRDDDREDGNADHRLPRDLDERIRQRARDDLSTPHDESVDAADDVQHREGHHETRHPADDGEEAVHESARNADREAHDEHEHDRDAVVMPEEIGGEKGRQPQHGSDREIDVAGEHDHRLTQSEQGEDRRVDEDELDVRQVEEPRLDRRRDEHEQREHRDDPELPDAEDEIDESARVGRFGKRRAPRAWVERRRHAAAWSLCPVAAATIDSSDASPWANSATSRPSRMTRMRSARRSTSGSSDEMMRIATPSAASSSSRRWTSAFVPTSIPRVGSSTISSDGLRPSHFARTTFCWFPPDNDVTGFVRRPYLTCNLAAQSRANRRSAAPRMKPARRSR